MLFSFSSQSLVLFLIPFVGLTLMVTPSKSLTLSLKHVLSILSPCFFLIILVIPLIRVWSSASPSSVMVNWSGFILSIEPLFIFFVTWVISVSLGGFLCLFEVFMLLAVIISLYCSLFSYYNFVIQLFFVEFILFSVIMLMFVTNINLSSDKDFLFSLLVLLIMSAVVAVALVFSYIGLSMLSVNSFNRSSGFSVFPFLLSTALLLKVGLPAILSWIPIIYGNMSPLALSLYLLFYFPSSSLFISTVVVSTPLLFTHIFVYLVPLCVFSILVTGRMVIVSDTKFQWAMSMSSVVFTLFLSLVLFIV